MRVTAEPRPIAPMYLDKSGSGTVHCYAFMACMTPEETPPPFTLEKAQRVALVVWSAITATVLLMLLAAASMSGDNTPVPSTPERDAFLRIFPILAAVNLLGSAVFFRFIKGRTHKKHVGIATKDLEASDSKRHMGFFGAMAISCALHEAIAVLGFVLSLISKNFADSLPYIGLAIVANLVVFPSRRKLEKF